MTMKVIMKIAGDAIIYREQSGWNVTFITNKDHVVRLYKDGNFVDDLRVAGQDRNIQVLPSDPQGDTGTGHRYSDILSMTHRKLHNGPNLIKGKNSGSGRELIHMNVPKGILAAPLDSRDYANDYWYESYPDADEGGFIGHEVARYVTISFDVSSGFGLRLVFGAGQPILFPLMSGQTLELFFDNNCHHGSREDFLHYYDWVKDRRPDKERKFIAGKAFRKDSIGEKSKMSLEGNCDPVVIDPPPV